MADPHPQPTEPSAHWEQVYQTRASTEVSWFRPHLETSLAFIEAAAPQPGARILDVGGGASTLVDDLLARGRRHLTVLDLSAAALQTARDRLGAAAASVNWLHADARDTGIKAQSIDVWHDRAVFHFLTEAADRRAYVHEVSRVLKRGGHLVIATFAPDGPQQCSGLPVVRYDADALAAVFGDGFQLAAQAADAHTTPGGNVQSFVYARFKRRG
ncbi:methyltransferase family protein [Tahibacter aquaticus]|uniref:Methyltransferase family protein n=1 Tax=Tahibacter aquaticus TaxID=520092 RepID=A0A4R6YPY0_9GAMM|nr:class I SAM-dependent methyltransferase [Tahibacter aquaticus]TDR39679.1 methyltransferase family protein [Tahibacter aquaticus]